MSARWTVRAADTRDVSSAHLPGPLVFIPETPADPDDCTGGMTWTDMVNVVAEIDPAAALVAAYGARYFLTYEDGRVHDQLWDDPSLPCCAGTVTFIEHRICPEHLGWLYGDVLVAAVEQERTDREFYRDTPEEIEAASVDVPHDINERCIAITADIDEAPANAAEINAYYRLPFWALGVPEDRINTYERAQIAWPEALTLEMYGPPTTDEALAALENPIAEITTHKVVFGTRRGHLALVL
jgi:hypothetical protein